MDRAPFPSFSATARRAPRRCIGVIATATVVSLLAAAASSGAPAAVTYPADATFSGGGSGWTAGGTCSALCTVGTTFASGEPNGSATVAYRTTLGLGGLDTGSEQLTSGSFAWSGPAPSSATIAVGRDATLPSSQTLDLAASFSVTLQDLTSGADTVLQSGSIAASDGGFTTLQAPVAPDLFIDGDTYDLVVALSFSSTVSVGATATVAFDQVALSADEAAASGASGSSGATGTSGTGSTGQGGTTGPSSAAGGAPAGPGTATSSGGASGPGAAGTQSAGSQAPPSPDSATPCSLAFRRVSRTTLSTCLQSSTLHLLVAFPWHASRVRITATGDSTLTPRGRGQTVGSITVGPAPTVHTQITARAAGALRLHGHTSFRVKRHRKWLVVTGIAPSARYVLLTLRYRSLPSGSIHVLAVASRARRPKG